VAVNLPPRFPLATLPTPLVRAVRMERALGPGFPPLYVKRDDLTGFAVAGNKARKLEFLVADALAQGCDTLLTGGGPGSNFCTASSAAAKVAGMSCVLVLYGEDPPVRPANLILAHRFGAAVRFTGDRDRASVDRCLPPVAEQLRAEGLRPYVIPRGGATAVGAVGYALAVAEMADQFAGAGLEPAMVVVATGSGGTQAGLVAGTASGQHPWRVIAASVSRPVDESTDRVLGLAGGCAELMGWPAPDRSRVEVRDARGPGYGLPSPEGTDAARLAARTEGLLLDPVFTAKAMARLLLVAREEPAGPVVFVHTGGLLSALDWEG
jgi:D-cysteine desulfhydrase